METLINNLIANLVLGGVLTISGVSYLWAIQYHFLKTEAGIDVKMKLMATLGAVTFCTHLVLILLQERASPIQFGIALTVGMLSFCVFVAAMQQTRKKRLHIAFSQAEPMFILTDGIYRWMRHPFYVAYAGTFLMTVIYTLHPLAITMTIIMVTIYIYAARSEEQHLLASSLGQAYEDYRVRTKKI